MHIDYAKELLERNKEQAEKHNWKEDAILLTVEKFVGERKFMDLAEKIGSDKTKDILKTIRENREKGNKYFKITDKMSHAVASDILSKLSIDEIIDCFKK